MTEAFGPFFKMRVYAGTPFRRAPAAVTQTAAARIKRTRYDFI